MRKIKNILLYIDNEKSVSNYWRGTGAFNELEKSGHIKTNISNWKESIITLRKYDIAFFLRPIFKHCLQQILMAKDCGLKIWIDLDDWYELPDNHPVKKDYDDNFDLKTFKTIMKAADIITVTNDKLRQAYMRFTESSKIKTIPNAINNLVLKQKEQSKENVIIWRGGHNHVNDMMLEAENIFNVMEENKRWVLITIGSRIKVFDKLINHKHIQKLSMHDYFGFILNLNPAIFVAPLEYNKFNTFKSNIIWQEATLSGAVCISPDYSSCEDAIQYTSSLKYTMNNVLNNKHIIDDNFERSKIELTNYYLSEVNKQRIKIINSL